MKGHAKIKNQSALIPEASMNLEEATATFGY